MIPLHTVYAIRDFLREHLGDLKLPAPDEKMQAIHFYTMALPQPGAQTMMPRTEDKDGNELPHKIATDDDDYELADGESGYTRKEAREIFPAVIIRPLKCTGDTDSESMLDELTVSITVGVYEDSNSCYEGLEWVVIILERMRQLFQKYRVLDERYEIQLPQTWELYDEVVRPFWFGEMVTVWSIPRLFNEKEGY